MSSSQRLLSLERRKERIVSQIAELEKLCNKCNQQIKGTIDVTMRTQLNAQLDNFSTEIDELYEKLEEIEKELNHLQLDEPNFSANNHLDNPHNQIELNLNECLCYIDFEKALKLFNLIESQFSQEADFALFFMEENRRKKGELFLRRLRYYLTCEKPKLYQPNVHHYEVLYQLDNEDFLKKLAKGQGEVTLESVVEQIGSSLQNNSLVLIEIKCDIYDPSEIAQLIPWLIDDFWQSLRTKVNEVIKEFEGIKVVAIIISDFLLKDQLGSETLAKYCHLSDSILTNFRRTKLISIPLEEEWTEGDIEKWLGSVNHRLPKSKKQKIARRIYATTRGHPNDVYDALKEDINLWRA